MAIIFSGGRISNRANRADPPLIISDGDARAAAWRDFREGLTPEERTFFTAPNANGRIGVSGAGQAARPRMGRHQPARERRRDEHVSLLIDAVRNGARTFFVMPVPVFQTMPATHQWVTNITTGSGRGLRIEINVYGVFPVEWLDLRTALGRTHRASRRRAQDACVYATHFPGHAIAPAFTRMWQRRRRGLVGSRRGDTVERWVDREDTVTLFHELIVHAVLGRPGHAGDFDEWVETRARLNWLRANPVGG